MKILAIDPATKTGWAHTNGESGVWDFSLKKEESSGVRFIKFRNNLSVVKNNVGMDLLVFEAARGFGHWNALSMHAKFTGVIEEFCAEHNLEYMGYVSTTIKKHATMNGKATKQDMIDRAKFKFKIDIIDDNHADVLWLLDLAKKELGIK